MSYKLGKTTFATKKAKLQYIIEGDILVLNSLMKVVKTLDSVDKAYIKLVIKDLKKVKRNIN